MFEDTSSLFTDQWQTHQTAVSKHFPPSGLHLPLPVLIAQGAEDAGELVGELQMPGHWGRKSVRVWIRAFFVVKENKRINEKRKKNKELCGLLLHLFEFPLDYFTAQTGICIIVI